MNILAGAIGCVTAGVDSNMDDLAVRMQALVEGFSEPPDKADMTESFQALHNGKALLRIPGVLTSAPECLPIESMP